MIVTLKKKAPISKLRLKKRLQKIKANPIKQQVKLEEKTRVDKEEVEPIKKIISATKVNSKIYKLSAYKKAILVFIYFSKVIIM